MPRKRKGLGEPDAAHVMQAEHALADAKRTFSNLPPTCYGAINFIARTRESIGEARAHLNALSRDERHKHDKLFGDLNRLDKKVTEATQNAQNSCPGTLKGRGSRA